MSLGGRGGGSFSLGSENGCRGREVDILGERRLSFEFWGGRPEVSYEGTVTNISGMVADRGRGAWPLVIGGGAPLSQRSERTLP